MAIWSITHQGAALHYCLFRRFIDGDDSVYDVEFEILYEMCGLFMLDSELMVPRVTW